MVKTVAYYSVKLIATVKVLDSGPSLV